MKFPKHKRLELPKYIEWLKKQPCSMMLPDCMVTWHALDGKTSKGDAHHVKSKGSGGHDNYCIPVCRICHTKIQNATEEQMEKWGTSREELYRIAIESFARYMNEVHCPKS